MKIIALVLLLIAAGTFGCTNSTNSTPVVIQVEDFYKEFQRSPDEFRAKYLDKEVTVMGKVRGTFNDDYTYNVVGYENIYIVGGTDDNMLHGVSCEVVEKDAAKFKGVTSGDVLSVKGKLFIKDGQFLIFKNCNRDFKS